MWVYIEKKNLMHTIKKFESTLVKLTNKLCDMPQINWYNP